MCHSGPYAPGIDFQKCRCCKTCFNQCPVNAIRLTDQKSNVDLGICLGCGICSEVCPNDAISMKIHPDRVRNETPPGFIRLTLIVMSIYLCILPLYFIYRFLTKSQQVKEESVDPRHSDIIS